MSDVRMGIDGETDGIHRYRDVRIVAYLIMDQ